MKLTPKQQRFVDEYLIDLNATQAYQRAGYRGSSNVAAVESCKLLRNPKVAAAIATAQAARAARVQLTQDAVLREIALLAYSNIVDYTIDDQGDVQVRDGVPLQALRAVASLKKKIIPTDAGPIYETEIKLWNKPMSLRMGGEHLGLFKQQVDVSGTVKVVRLPEKAASAEAWLERQQGYGHRGTDLGSATEAN